MTVSAKDIRAQMARARSYLHQLGASLEERRRLTEILKLTPSQADNIDLIDLLSKIQTTLRYLKLDISSGYASDFAGDFSDIVDEYQNHSRLLQDDAYIDIKEYGFSQKIQHSSPEPEPTKKSVRFKDDEHETDDITHMRNQLMGTSGNFKPYRDEDDDTPSLLSVDTTNQELFALHQQQLLAQDQSLDNLHDLVRVQHSMGLTINDELDDHLILLNDLERGVDTSSSRLWRATNNIREFRRKVRENGSLVTIIVLTVILILLLVVLN